MQSERRLMMTDLTGCRENGNARFAREMIAVDQLFEKFPQFGRRRQATYFEFTGSVLKTFQVIVNGEDTLAIGTQSLDCGDSETEAEIVGRNANRLGTDPLATKVPNVRFSSTHGVYSIAPRTNGPNSRPALHDWLK